MSGRTARFGLVVLLATAGSLRAGEAAPLSLAERIDCERRIQEVFWRHRLWPKENPTPKPALLADLPQSRLSEKVDDDLRKSAALGYFWERPITGEQLQAEMDRMARDTKDPAVLRELFEALGNDPHRIAECLARPGLVDRLARRWYAADERFHGALKASLQTTLAGLSSADGLKNLGGEYAEWESETAPAGADGLVAAEETDAATRRLSPKQWEEQMTRLRGLFGHGPEAVEPTGTTVPVGRASALHEDEDGFSVVAVLSQSPDRLRIARVTWRKRSFGDWWHEVRPTVGRAAEPAFDYHATALAASACTDDTWRPTQIVADRSFYPALFWTGTEMIVWGGNGRDISLRSPLLYNPATDTWRTGNYAGAPPSYFGSAVWTGTELLAWGGCETNTCASISNQGGRYNPSTDVWVPISNTNAPTPRTYQSTIWTGSEMIVWGGRSGGALLSSGGRYNPVSNTWVGITAPLARDLHTAVWTGTEMIVWGGRAEEFGVFGYVNDGLRYDANANTWTLTSTTGAPSGRSEHSAIWSGSEMIVWGGYGDAGHLATGGRYSPGSDTWTTTISSGAPTARRGQVAVWTGSEMIIWGGVNYSSGFLNTGSRYDPSGDRWLETSLTNAPQGRYYHGAVWNGAEMFVFGGLDAAAVPTAGLDGGRYSPASNSWLPIHPLANAPVRRQNHTAVWTGSEMIIWGGIDTYTTGKLDSGGLYRPAMDLWTATSLTSAPSARWSHTAVWAGSEMIVWGGVRRNRGPIYRQPLQSSHRLLDAHTDDRYAFWAVLPLCRLDRHRDARLGGTR